MKVYYEMPDNISDKTQFQYIIDLVENENKSIATKFIEHHIELLEEMVIIHLGRTKFQAMWSLRSIEDMINDEGGSIIVHIDGSMDFKNFSEGLSTKARQLLLDKM